MEKIKVLYIDDEESNLVAFKASFRRSFTVFVAKSAEEGLKVLQTEPIEVLVSDQKMPKITGVEFFASILDSYPNPVRILLTAHADISAVIDAINKGQVYRYINKPWNEDELRLTIEDAYKLYALREQNKKLNLKYKKVFTDSSDPILLFDTKGQIFDYNQATLDLLQITSDSQNVPLFSSIISDKKEAAYIMDTISNNKPIKDYECQIISSKNVKRNCLISVNAVKDSYGETINYQAIIKDITEKSEMNKMLLKTVIETQEAERGRISNDLHDGIGQSLAAIRLHLDSLRINVNGNNKERFTAIDVILDNSVKQLRRICSDTLPPVLANHGLIEAVKELCATTSSSSFKINFSYSRQFPKLNKSLMIALYRITQEFLNNSLKHSKASQTFVNIKNEDGYIILNLTDNGIGFNINDLMIYNGQGLKNIRSRVESFNGKINFNSALNKGTEFDISIPFIMNEN